MKSSTVKMALGAIVLSGAMGAVSAEAVAMPVLNGAAVAPGSPVEKTRWVCGPYGCGWRPNYYGYGYGYRPYGYYRPRPHYWGRPAYWGGGWGHRHGWGHHW